MKGKYLMVSGLGLILISVAVGAARMQHSVARRSAAGQVEGNGTNRKHVDISSRSIPVRLASVRNLNAPDWIKSLELEIENRSRRPIYYVRVNLMFPDVPKSTEVDGIPRGLSTTLVYGRKDFLAHPGELARPEDIPIKPGDKAVLRLDPPRSEGLKRYLSDHNLPESAIKRLRVRIEDVSFGDGSGYRSGSIPFFPRSSSQNRPPADDRSGRLNLMKASYVPVQYGCQGQPWVTCQKMKEVDESCAIECGRHYFTSGGVSATDPDALCIGKIFYDFLPCSIDGIEYTCPNDRGYSCQESLNCGHPFCDVEECLDCETNYDPVHCVCPEDCSELDCNTWAPPEGYTGSCCMSPILVDVAGNGFNLTDAAGGVNFDLTGDGIAEHLSWTAASSDDAFLALDRDGNGTIDNGRELFGTYTPQPTSREPNGFLALLEYDKPANGGNADGHINRRDWIFSSLRMWQDTNHNGISEPNELHRLQSVEVQAIDLNYKASRRTDQYGNRFRYRAKVRDARGAHVGQWAWDVFFVKQ